MRTTCYQKDSINSYLDTTLISKSKRVIQTTNGKENQYYQVEVSVTQVNSELEPPTMKKDLSYYGGWSRFHDNRNFYR
jgi:hypothetical protein